MNKDVEKIRAEIERRKDSLGFVELDLRKQLKFDVYKGLLSFIDSMQDEPKTDWLQELQDKLYSLSKEDFEKVMAKYSIYGSVDYDKLNAMLDESLSTETKESWNKRLGEEEPVSKNLENAALEYATHYDKNWSEVKDGYIAENEVEAFKAGAKWQKNHLLKPADGDDLPEINREVIALFDNNKVRYIGYAHRPPEYWDGKDIDSDKVTRYYPQRYDKGGWNIPNIKYWLDVELPEETEL